MNEAFFGDEVRFLKEKASIRKLLIKFRMETVTLFEVLWLLGSKMYITLYDTKKYFV